MADTERKPRTTDELRTAIDSGETGDKVEHVEPAAAPLGTDDEAAGRPAPPGRVDTAFEQEVRETPLPSRPTDTARKAVIWVGVAIVVIAILAVLL